MTKALTREADERTSRFGGTLDEMPHPLVRLFPGARRKRRVTVTFSTYYGIGTHIFVDLIEEDNPVWDGERWAKPWHDPEGKGRSFLNRFNGDQKTQARRWVRETWQENFADGHHVLIDDKTEIYGRPIRAPRWFYRDGD